MMRTLNRVGLVFFVEFMVLLPILMLATDFLARRGWRGVAQISLFYGVILAALVGTVIINVVLRKWFDHLMLDSPRIANIIEGRGQFGAYMLTAIAFSVVWAFATHPMHLTLIWRALGWVE